MADCIVWTYDAIAAKADGKPLSFVDRLIMFRSKPYTHTEFQFSERFDNVSFSATMKDKARCCRFKDIKYTHPQRWKKHIIPMSDTEEDLAFQKAKEIEWLKYDLLGLSSFIIMKWRIVRPSKLKYWCSECVACLLVVAKRLNLIPDELHPLGLVERLDEYAEQWRK